MQNKLARWKSKTLSFMGRATLIQAVTSAMPSYAMQTTALPANVCESIDKINRNFLWGDSSDQRKFHLVKWDEVCKSKRDGGLGIRKAKDTNLALLSKLGWKIQTEKKVLWVEILRKKYLSNHSLQA